MPPKQKVSPEEKLKIFEEWKATSPEYAAVIKFMALREQQPHTAAPDNAWCDISDDWAPFLNELFLLGDVLKVPGRKAKCKYPMNFL